MQTKYHRLPALNPEFIDSKEHFLLFETGLFSREDFQSYIFTDPVKVIRVMRYQDVKPAFARIEELSRDHYLAGYFSYELGYYFENTLFRHNQDFSYPLIYLCAFKQPTVFNHKTGRISKEVPGLFDRGRKQDDFSIRHLRLSFDGTRYAKKIRRLKEYIRCGDAYQVNFTGKYLFDFQGSAFSLYQYLKNRQSVPYASFCKLKSEHVISLSPELFFKRNGLDIYSKPMKGTINRGKSAREDKERSDSLSSSLKDRAENLMIVDLIRNDLGRISKTGSVAVAGMFDIEKYNTLFQMTSTVKSRLKKDTTYFEIFRNIFPGGSVTGAPKIRTMQIIRELEDSPRKVYCGALGLISPGKKAVFNMPIRTITLAGGKGEMGTGSGIVYDSKAQSEFRECILKARFLTEKYSSFYLLETIAWNGRYRFLKEHLKRMEDSAKYFGFSFDRKRITGVLRSSEKGFQRWRGYRVRLLLDQHGDLRVECFPIARQGPKPQEKYIAFSRYRRNPQDVFCYHKTTNRQLYDREYRSHLKEGYLDVIFLNTRGEVTEGAVSNLVIKKGRKFFTPPVSCGLLPGIFRDFLIKKYRAKEQVIYPEDLLRADKIFLCNSVRGLTQVKIRGLKE
ncbi:aminodeoxychorismate synthase component I [Candidatus Omnitrophota bacterium]